MISVILSPVKTAVAVACVPPSSRGFAILTVGILKYPEPSDVMVIEVTTPAVTDAVANASVVSPRSMRLTSLMYASVVGSLLSSKKVLTPST